ncbi:MAG: serine hydrolase domain-containing protein [Xanthomonadales bacterium]|nr:serine hydrolase domain-containing protein [Xanthomonadales bacterium]
MLLFVSHAAESQRQWQAHGEALAPELQAFEDWVQRFMQENDISGGSLAVTKDSRLVLTRGYTWTDDPEDLVVQSDSRFRIASLGKSITAMGIMHLVQHGQLSLDARVVDLVDMPEPFDSRVRDIKVRQLLQHLGGWDRDVQGDPVFLDGLIADRLQVSLPVSKTDIVEFVAAEHSLVYPPGTTFAYSNFGYMLAGMVIEKVSGLSYEQYLQRRVFYPLGVRGMSLARSLYEHRQPDEAKYQAEGQYPSVMSDSQPLVPLAYGAFNMDNADSAGGWIASAADLARYAASLDRPEKSAVLGRSAVDTLLGLPENIRPSEYARGDAYYAMGWSVRDYGTSRTTWHGGGIPGTMTYMVRRNDGVTYVALFNKRENALYEVMDRELWQAANAVVSWPDMDLFNQVQPLPNGGETYGGLMYDRARDGHGLDIRAAGSLFNILFYTYDALGAPEWYIAQGQVHEQLFVADAVYRVTYDTARSPPQQLDLSTLGHFIIDFRESASEAACNDGTDRSSAEQTALFDWSINGERGQWCVEPLKFGDGAPTPDINGTWYAGPEDDGWGMTVAVQGESLFVVLYFYDALGQPRFSIGSANGFTGSSVNIPMLQVDGFCRSCSREIDVAENGTMQLSLSVPTLQGDTSNSVSLDVEFLGPNGGRWQRDSVPMRLLTNPVD